MDNLSERENELLPVGYEESENDSPLDLPKVADVCPDEEKRYYEIFDKDRPKSKGFSAAAMVIGILSVALFFLEIVPFILGVFAIAFSLISRRALGYFDRMSLAGIILGIFGSVLGIFSFVCFFIFGDNIKAFVDGFLTR